MLQVQSPYTQLFDLNGDPLNNGYVYIGSVNTNAETNPIPIWWDDAGTIPAAQPLRTQNGYIVRNGSPARVFTSAEDFSITVKDKRGRVVYSELDVNSQSNLASSLALSSGATLIGFIQAGAGAVLRTLQSKNRDIISAFDYMTPAQIASAQAGDLVQDVWAPLQAAVTYAGTIGAEVELPYGLYKLGSTLVVPPTVTLRGAGYSYPVSGYNPTTRSSGAVLQKAHSGNCITVTGAVAYADSAGIYGLTFISNNTTWPSGDAIVIDKVGEYTIERCVAYSMGGNGFTIGVTAGDVTGQVNIRHCYVNNCKQAAYRLRAKWTRGFGNKSDGCTHHLYMLDASETHWESWHGEGFTTGCIHLFGTNASSRFTSKGFCGNTGSGATFGIKIENTSGNFDITIDGVKFQGSSSIGSITFTAPLAAATSGTLSAAFAGTTGSYALVFSDGSIRTATLTNGSTAVSWTGAVTATATASTMTNPGFVAVDIGGNGVYATVRNCEFNQCVIGVNDSSTIGTKVLENHFYQCGTSIYSNSSTTRYHLNSFDSNIGFDIDHQSGGSGVWSENSFGKGIKPTLSGVVGSYSTNLVISNTGLKTRAGGVTGAIASGTAIPHGLIASPATALISPVSPFSLPASFTIATDATNITPSWGGGGNLQLSWLASCVCANQG